jgi:3-oxoacyl-[acyl-carrier-protein] synthase II
MLVGSGDLVTDQLHEVHDRLGRTATIDNPMCPYDIRSTKPYLGEGVGVLVLERWARAEQRGIRTYAKILGLGFGNDPMCEPHRFTRDEGTVVAAIERSLHRSRLDPAQIDIVSGSASSEADHDRLELAGATRAFRGTDTWLVAPKAYLGDAPADGCMRLAMESLFLFNQFLPPALGLQTPVCDTHLRWVDQSLPIEACVAVHLATARGGQAISIVLEGG